MILEERTISLCPLLQGKAEKWITLRKATIDDWSFWQAEQMACKHEKKKQVPNWFSL